MLVAVGFAPRRGHVEAVLPHLQRVSMVHGVAAPVRKTRARQAVAQRELLGIASMLTDDSPPTFHLKREPVRQGNTNPTKTASARSHPLQHHIMPNKCTYMEQVMEVFPK